jgi:ADP-ribose pyrophosphatase YjhB (NUDIX family)
MAKEKVVYKGNYIKVTEQKIGNHNYERGYFMDGVVLFPFTKEGKLFLIKEKRPSETPSVRWKLISGYNEKNLPLKKIANQELQEEVGLKAKHICEYLSLKRQGTINRTTKYAICTNLTESKLPNPDGEDSVLKVTPVDIKKVEQMALKGKLDTNMNGYVLLLLCHEILSGKLKIKYK